MSDPRADDDTQPIGPHRPVATAGASAVTADLANLPQLTNLSEAEIKERLSGNLCRCSAYNGIVAAVQQVTGQAPPSPAAAMLLHEAGGAA